MKLQAQIEALENLAKLDVTIAVMESELEKEGKELLGKKSQLERLEERYSRTQASVVDMDRMRGELLQEARHMSLQMDRSREKLARSRTEREVNAVQREIEELRKLYRDRETEIEKINGLAEQARKELEAASAERDALLGDMGANEAEVSSKLGELEARVGAEHEKRRELVKVVPGALYRRYEMIRKRRGTALASTTDGTCSECNIAIAPMLFQELRRREEFTRCPSCQRILYYRPPPDPEEAAAEGSAEDAGG